MSRVVDFDKNQHLMPFSPIDTGVVSFHLVLGIVATIGVSTVLVACMRKKSSPSTLMLLSLCWADLMFAVSVVIMEIYDLSKNAFAIGPIGCIIDGFIIFFSCTLSICSLFFITLERCIELEFNLYY
jgi:hypothetical protein